MEEKPEIKEGKQHITYKWVVKNVPAIECEPSMPPLDELAKKVVITSLSSWNQVASWYYSLAKEAMFPCKEVRSAAGKVTQGSKTKEEAIRRIYNFVSQNIRYVGMEFGINGYKPHKACEVLKNRYGDCKDHATLLIAMLRAIGVKAYPVLIPTQDTANLDPDVPRPTAFDHEIAAVVKDGHYVFLDTTSEVTPFGDLPSGDQGRRVLVVEGKRAVLAETPIFPPERNVECYRGSFVLNGNGGISGSMKFIYKGLYAGMERYLFITSTVQDIKRHIEGLASSISPGMKVIRFHVSPYRDLNSNLVTIELEGKDHLYAVPTAHFLILHPPVPGYSKLARLVAPEKRHYTYVVGYRMSKKISMELRIPSGYRVYLLPEDYSYKNRVGSFSITWKNNGSMVAMDAVLTLKRAFIPPGLYTDLKDLFSLTVKSLRNQVVILKRLGS